jgi:hypothetical protein
MNKAETQQSMQRIDEVGNGIRAKRGSRCEAF